MRHEACRAPADRGRCALQAGRRDQRRAVPQRALRDLVLPRSAYIRVHVQPIRYPAAHATDWKARGPRGVPATSSRLRVLRRVGRKRGPRGPRRRAS